jgi:hypothetical protein
MLPAFAAVPDLKARSRIGAVLGIRIDKLSNITDEQLEVWNITPDYNFITLKLEFDPYFLSEAKVPRIQVGMSKELSVTAPLEGFRLSWTILERAKNVVLSSAAWPPEDIKMDAIPDASAVNDLMEMTGAEYAVCLKALKKAGGDKATASAFLFDEKQKKKLMKSLPTPEECRKKLKGIIQSISGAVAHKRVGEDAGEDWMVKFAKAPPKKQAAQLSRAFDMTKAGARCALKELGYDKAVVQLSSAESRSFFESMAITISESKRDAGYEDDEMFDEDEDIDEDLLETMGVDDSSKKSKTVFGSVAGGLKSLFRRRSSENIDDEKFDIDGPGMLMRTLSDNTINLIGGTDMERSMALMLDHNFLLRILIFALRVLKNGNRFCMICDTPLEFAGLKPSICIDPFCQFRHDSIGLGFSLSSEIMFRTELTDLLISCCYSACLGGRVDIFFPEAVRGVDEFQDESFMTSAGARDVEKLKKVLLDCPKLEEMKEVAKSGDLPLKAYLKTINPLLHPLLVWIITSNRAHLRKLKKEEEIPGIPSKMQFTLASATPAKESEFQSIQATNGSFLAWHGSPMANWHSILRMGLKNYSKTKKQMHGAAYGAGIYLATNFGMSAGYCRYSAGNAWPNSMFTSGISCMAICEVCYHDSDVGKGLISKSASAVASSAVATKKVEKMTEDTSTGAGGKHRHDGKNYWLKTSGIYVVDREECVMTRFFLLFEGAVPHKTIDANSLVIPKVVKSTL